MVTILRDDGAEIYETKGGIYNLFDKTYYNAVALKDLNNTTVPSNSNTAQPLDFYSEPGRVFKISLVQRF